MENAHKVLQLSEQHLHTSFLGLFDGRGGSQVSTKLVDGPQAAIGALPELSDSTLTTALLGFDKQFDNVSTPWEGPTCLVALLKPTDDHIELTIINVGDSFGLLLAPDGRRMRLTTDHNRMC